MRIVHLIGTAAMLGTVFAVSAGAVRAQASPLEVNELAPGVFVHVGEVAVMMRANAGVLRSMVSSIPQYATLVVYKNC